MSIKERWSFKFHIVTNIREYELYAPSEDERELWLHTFFWIVELNSFQKVVMETQLFRNQIRKVYNAFKNLDRAKRYHLSKSPNKLEKILCQLNNGTKQPVEGDVKAIIDLEQKIKKVDDIQPNKFADVEETNEEESDVSIVDKHAQSREDLSEQIKREEEANRKLDEISKKIELKKKLLKDIEQYKQNITSSQLSDSSKVMMNGS
jgi:prophage DNA circulation protein